MEKLAENDLAYFYLCHVVIIVTAVTTISLMPLIYRINLSSSLQIVWETKETGA
jgi:hypothetical protein